MWRQEDLWFWSQPGLLSELQGQLKATWWEPVSKAAPQRDRKKMLPFTLGPHNSYLFHYATWSSFSSHEVSRNTTISLGKRKAHINNALMSWRAAPIKAESAEPRFTKEQRTCLNQAQTDTNLNCKTNKHPFPSSVKLAQKSKREILACPHNRKITPPALTCMLLKAWDQQGLNK